MPRRVRDTVLNLSAPRARDTQNPLAIQCQRGEAGDAAEPLLILLRRFATESAREEARMFCDELIADEAVAPIQHEPIAA